MRTKLVLPVLLLAFLAALFPKFSLSDEASLPAALENSQPQQCRAFFNNDGYFFDSFEKAEYQNGFLVLHLKLKPTYNDGRFWGGKIFMHKDDCSTSIYPTSSVLGSNTRPGQQLWSIRFTSATHYDLWDDEQDIKMECADCSVDIPGTWADGSAYTAISYSGDIDAGASFMHTGSYSIIEQKVAAKTPVIIIPGILGTQLTFLDQVVWPNLERMVLEKGDKFMDPLEMDSNGNSKNTIFPSQVIKKIDYVFGAFHNVDLLANDLTSQGYEEGKNLILFKYDWRLGLNEISPSLVKTIQDTLYANTADKVDIVAHSLGGLVLKNTLANNPDLESKLDKVVFAGVPNIGSAEAAKALVFGSSLDIPLLNDQEILFLAQNMPSIYTLLPDQEYFKIIPGWFDDITDPLLTHMLTYEQSKALLSNMGKNQTLLKKAEDIHSSLDGYDFSGKPFGVYNLTSCGEFTLKTITKMRKGSTFLDKILHRPKYQIYTDTGDGTVLLKSAAAIKGAQNLLFSGVKHNQLLAADSTRAAILQVLNGGSPSLPAANCAINGKLISLSSDVDITFVDKETNKVVKPGEEIPVEKVGEDNFVYLADGALKNYTVNITPKSTSAGEKFSFDVTQYKDSNNKTYHFNEISINKDNTYALDTLGDNPLLKTTDGGGNSTTTLPELDDPQSSDDHIAPVSAIFSYPSNHPSYGGVLELEASESEAVLLATDVGSGVAKVEYSFDSENWKTVQSAERIDVPASSEEIYFFSVDKAGNYEDVVSVQITRKAEARATQNSTQVLGAEHAAENSSAASDDSSEEANTEENQTQESNAADEQGNADFPIQVNINLPDNLLSNKPQVNNFTYIFHDTYNGSNFFLEFLNILARLIFF